MKTRKERVAEFMANVDNLSIARLRVACYVRKPQLPELNDMAQVIAALKQEFAEHEESWMIDDIANEYNRIANMSDHNLQIWANYRRNCNANEPIAKANGDFIEVKAVGIKVVVDGTTICIDDHDFVSIEADCGSDVGAWSNVSFAAMEKMVQIKNHWNEIKRLVE
jgi:hypothetical protein